MNIPIDRDNLKRSYDSWSRAADVLKSGTSIGIYPEGKIPFDTPKLAPFKNGPFKLAIAAQAPVVPITFVHNWKLLPPWPTLAGPGGRPGFSFVKMHTPIPTEGMTEDDVSKLRTQTYEVINEELKRHGYNRQDS